MKKHWKPACASPLPWRIFKRCSRPPGSAGLSGSARSSTVGMAVRRIWNRSRAYTGSP